MQQAKPAIINRARLSLAQTPGETLALEKSPREYCLSNFGIAAEAEQLPETIHGVTKKSSAPGSRLSIVRQLADIETSKKLNIKKIPAMEDYMLYPAFCQLVDCRVFFG